MGLTNLKTLIWTNKCIYKINKIRLDFIGKLCNFLTAPKCQRVEAGGREPRFEYEGRELDMRAEDRGLDISKSL